MFIKQLIINFHWVFVNTAVPRWLFDDKLVAQFQLIVYCYSQGCSHLVFEHKRGFWMSFASLISASSKSWNCFRKKLKEASRKDKTSLPLECLRCMSFKQLGQKVNNKEMRASVNEGLWNFYRHFSRYTTAVGKSILHSSVQNKIRIFQLCACSQL